MWEGKDLKPSLSSGTDSGACVSQVGPPHICAKMMRVRVKGPQGGFVWTTEGHHGNLEPEGL